MKMGMRKVNVRIQAMEIARKFPHIFTGSS